MVEFHHWKPECPKGPIKCEPTARKLQYPNPNTNLKSFVLKSMAIIMKQKSQ